MVRSVLPQLQFEPQLLLRAQAIKVVFFDVDGVLTDGGLFFSDEGEVLKRFNTLDGHGIKLLQAAGMSTAADSGLAELLLPATFSADKSARDHRQRTANRIQTDADQQWSMECRSA